MGRNPKPASLHLLEGKKPHRSNEELERKKKAEESLNFPSDSIKYPTWLRKGARKYFTNLVNEFAGLDLLRNVDVNAIALYADALYDYVTYTNTIEEEGHQIFQTNKAGATNRIPHPLITKKVQLFQQMDKLMGKFGLSPIDRAKLVQNMQVNDDESDNSFSDRL